MPPSESGERWSLRDVYLLTEGEDGRVAIPELRLEFVAEGIRVSRDKGQPVWQCSWDALVELSTAERSVLPNGGEGVVVLVVERAGRRHRFVLPADDQAELEHHLRQVAVAHRLATSPVPRAVSRSLTLAVVLATLATLTVLLLSAVHVVRF